MALTYQCAKIGPVVQECLTWSSWGYPEARSMPKWLEVLRGYLARLLRATRRYRRESGDLLLMVEVSVLQGLNKGYSIDTVYYEAYWMLDAYVVCPGDVTWGRARHDLQADPWPMYQDFARMLNGCCPKHLPKKIEDADV